MKELKYQGTVKRWDMFEVALEGPKEGNPFTEQEVRAEFCGDQETVSCDLQGEIYAFLRGRVFLYGVQQLWRRTERRFPGGSAG